MPLPVRRAPRPDVVLACKAWKPADVAAEFEKRAQQQAAARGKPLSAAEYAEGLRRAQKGARMLYLMAAVNWVHGGMPESLWARLAEARDPRRGILHTEFAVTYACTWRDAVVDARTGRPVPGTGAGSCDAPGCNGVVRPYHAVTYSCAERLGVHGKEWPRQQDEDVWSRYDLWHATPEEVYRLKLYAHAMLGAGYRGFSPLTYMCGARSPLGVDASGAWRYYIRMPRDLATGATASGTAGALAPVAACTRGLLERVWKPPTQQRPQQQQQQTPRPPPPPNETNAHREARIACDMRERMREDGCGDGDAEGAPISLDEYDATRSRSDADADAPLLECARRRRARFDEHLTSVLARELVAVLASDVERPYAATAECDALRERALQTMRETGVLRDGGSGDGDGSGSSGGASGSSSDDGSGDGSGGSGSFDLAAHIDAKLRVMHAVACDVRDATTPPALCSMEGSYIGLCDFLNENRMVTTKRFTCAEFTAAALLFAGFIRGGIDPHTSLLNSLLRTVVESGRASPYASVGFYDVFPRDSNAARAELPAALR